MAILQAEYLRSIQMQDPQRAGVLRIYMENAPILGQGFSMGLPLPTLNFETGVGGQVSLVREKTLPTVGVRALNEKFTPPSEGETEKVSESFIISGGAVELDRALRKRGGQQGLITQQVMKISALSRFWNKMFYKGVTANGEFQGLQFRIAAGQTLNNEGAGLNLNLLDQALINLRGGSPVIAMNSQMLARIFSACRTSRNVNFTPETYGKSPASYNGVPIMLAGENADESEVLDFSEAGDTTSIYVMSLNSEMGVTGVETEPLQIYNPNGVDAVDSSYEIEWDSSFWIKWKRAAYRIKNIANLPVGSIAEEVED